MSSDDFMASFLMGQAAMRLSRSIVDPPGPTFGLAEMQRMVEDHNGVVADYNALLADYNSLREKAMEAIAERDARIAALERDNEQLGHDLSTVKVDLESSRQTAQMYREELFNLRAERGESSNARRGLVRSAEAAPPASPTGKADAAEPEIVIIQLSTGQFGYVHDGVPIDLGRTLPGAVAALDKRGIHATHWLPKGQMARLTEIPPGIVRVRREPDGGLEGLLDGKPVARVGVEP